MKADPMTSMNLTRRAALAATVAAASLAGVPASATILALPADRSAWDRAVALLKEADAALERMDAVYTPAHEAAEAACPYQKEFFTRYHLGSGISRDSNFRSAHMNLVIERAKGRPNLTAEEAKAIAADANRIVDEFETWSKRREIAFRGYDEIEKRFDTLVDERADARQAVIDTAAPDPAAMLFKMELVSEIMRECGAEDAESVAAIRNDARRLLAN